MRIIEAPGIELHEIDRSQYDDTYDSSIVGTTTFLMGFADKGDDYTTKYINSMKTFVNNYGYPTNEAERYFYNAAYEVINRGGYLLASKLPYDNESLRKYAYCSYTVNDNLIHLSSPYDVVTSDFSLSALSGVSLYDFLLMPKLANKDDEEEKTIINVLTENNIHLPIITKLFEYILNQCNFKYSTQEFIKNFFYLSD